VTHSEVNLIIHNRVEGSVNQIIGRTPTEKMEKIQLIGSSSPYESNPPSPTRGRRPLPFKRDLMGLSLLSFKGSELSAVTFVDFMYHVYEYSKLLALFS
jgi:hypothetical protein